MNGFARHRRLRSLVSGILAFAMAFSMVVVPAGAAVPSVGDLTSIVSGGTNLAEFGNVAEAEFGINGVASVEVTGSLATRSRLEGAYGNLTDATRLSTCGVKVFNKFKVLYGAPGQAAVATTITGLTSTSTVGILRQKIEAQLPNVTTSIEPTANRLWLTADQYGRCPLATTDVTYGVGPVIFGKGLVGQLDAFGNPLGTATTNKTFGRTFSGGSGYDGAYFGGGEPLAAHVSFAVAPGAITYHVGSVALGTLDQSGDFVSSTNDRGLYTAVRLPLGYDAVLSTAGGAGIGLGTAAVTLAGGDRDPMRPDFTITHGPDPVEAGQATTITATFSGMNEAGGAGGVDMAEFTLPAGFVPSATGATAKVGDVDATLGIDVGARTISASGFFATEDQPLVITLASQVPTVPGEYPVSGTYSNVDDAATYPVTAFGKIQVVGLGIDVEASPALEGDTNFGFARAHRDEYVTFTVRTNVPKAGQTILAAPVSVLGVGTLDSTTATTDENGVAVFTVRSDVPSVDGDMEKYGRYFKEFEFTYAADTSLTTSAFASFYTYEVKAIEADKRVAFADGQDGITYTFMAYNPVTREPAPAGTRVYFTPAGYDRADTALSPSSALCDSDGVVSVKVTRDEPTSITATGTTGLAWVLANTTDDFSGIPASAGPPAGTPPVEFFDYIAVPETTITAQQSARGAAARGDFVLKNAAGDTVEFATLDAVAESTSTDVLKAAPLTAQLSGDGIRVDVEVKADEPNNGIVRTAGDIVCAGLFGRATAVGAFGSSKQITFGIDMPVHIVNNAAATGRGSIYLGKASITGSGLKPGTASIRAVQNGNSYTLTGTTIGVDLDGSARPQLFDMPVTMLKGTYDLVIDGITFPDALVVGDGISIGVTKVVITMGASKGVYPNYATKGSSVTLFGVVTTTGNANVPTSIVNVYSSTSSTGADPVFIGQVLTSNGQFGYRVTADRGRYYWATCEPNGQYAPGDSRDVFGGPLYVGVKTFASLKVSSAPLTARVSRDFTVKGTLPKHDHDTQVVVRAYKLVGTKWVLKQSFTTPVAAGTTSYARTVNITSKGKWALGITHADYDHLPSTSRYRFITIK